jgi:hypothetical protein
VRTQRGRASTVERALGRRQRREFVGRYGSTPKRVRARGGSSMRLRIQWSVNSAWR